MEKATPLEGKTVICTCPGKEPDELADRLRADGAVVISMPTIAIKPLSFRVRENSEVYDWLVFTSKNAVMPFIGRFRPAPSNRIAAIGPGTASRLTEAGYTPHYTGHGATAADFAKELGAIIPSGNRILLVLGKMAPSTLQETLAKKHLVERVDVYRTTVPPVKDRAILEQIVMNRYDMLVVSSPSAIRNLAQLLPKTKKDLRIASIGSTTTSAIRELGIEPVLTATEPRFSLLGDLIRDYLIADKQDRITNHNKS